MAKDEIDQTDQAKERQLIKNMEESFDFYLLDKEAPEVIGEAAPKKYFAHYKNIDKVRQ